MCQTWLFLKSSVHGFSHGHIYVNKCINIYVCSHYIYIYLMFLHCFLALGFRSLTGLVLWTLEGNSSFYPQALSVFLCKVLFFREREKQEGAADGQREKQSPTEHGAGRGAPPQDPGP